jgi:hypothetical protein
VASGLSTFRVKTSTISGLVVMITMSLDLISIHLDEVKNMRSMIEIDISFHILKCFFKEKH